MLSRAVIYMLMKLSAWQSSVFSPTAASAVAGILVAAIMYYALFVVVGSSGDFLTFSRLLFSILGIILFMPIFFVLGGIFYIYIRRASRGHRFVSDLTLYTISAGCLLTEFLWLWMIESWLTMGD